MCDRSEGNNLIGLCRSHFLREIIAEAAGEFCPAAFLPSNVAVCITKTSTSTVSMIKICQFKGILIESNGMKRNGSLL